MLDVQTLMTVISLVALVSALIMFMLWQIDKEREGVFFWFVSSLLIAVAYASPLLSSALPFPGIGIFINNVLIITSILLMVEGALRFRGYISEWRWILGLPIIVVVALVAWLNMDDPAGRYRYIDLISISAFLAIGRIMTWKPESREQLKIHSIPAAFCVLISLVLLARWLLSLGTQDAAGLERLAAYNGVLFLAFLLFTMGWTYSIMLACYYRVHENILQMAREDALTGLPNRRSVDEALNREILRSSRSGDQFAVIVLDLDDFKQVNDSLGHVAGDELLIEISQRLKDQVRDADFVGRMGGDEFLILLHNIKTESEQLAALQRLKRAIDKPVSIKDAKFEVRASAGIAIWGIDGETADELLRSADRRMYRDKNAN